MQGSVLLSLFCSLARGVPFKFGIVMDSRAMPLPCSHPPPPPCPGRTPCSGCLPRDLEQLAIFLLEVRGMVSAPEWGFYLGDSGLELRLGPEYSPPQEVLGVGGLRPGRVYGQRRTVGKLPVARFHSL